MLVTDSEASKDLLNRKVFAAQVVKSLTSSFKNDNESLVIGLAGKWGSGKSTLLSFIKDEINFHYLDSPQDHKVISFNSWANTSEQELERNFFESILTALSEIDWKNPIKTANNSFKKYLEYIHYIKFVRYAHPIAEKVIDSLTEYAKTVNISTIEEIKIEANSLLQSNNLKLYILVDDLDRLTPEEILTLFKILKVSLNLKNTFFIIAYDKEVVIDALEKHYGKNGEKYLEKIIQVDFPIPQILESQIEDLYFSRIREQLSNLKIENDYEDLFSTWRYKGLKEYFKTIRDLNRYFNNLMFSIPNIRQEINVNDFLILEAIKTFDYKSYEKLYGEVLTIKRKAVWESISFGVESIKKFESDTTRSLLTHLFVKNHRYTLNDDSLNEKRLRDPNFFERYYSLHVSAKDIVEDTIKLFFTSGTDKGGLIREIMENDKVGNFLRRISDRKLRNFYTVDDENIFHSFLSFWEKNRAYVTASLDELIWSSYFNLAHSFIDTHKGAAIAINELILQSSSELQFMRFVFNHYIHLFKIEKRTDPQFHSDVKSQTNVLESELESKFLEYLEKQHQQYEWEIIRGRSDWISNLFIYSFARFRKEKYLEQLNYYFNHPRMIIFIVKENFFSRDKRIRFDNRDIFFPGEIFGKVVDELKKVKKGVFNKQEQEYKDAFLDSI